MSEYDRTVDEWRLSVGKALLSFGDIELVARNLLAQVNPDVAEKLSHKKFPKFQDHVDPLIETIEARWASKSAAVDVVKKFKEAKDLTKVRNTIAHNPLQLEYFHDTARVEHAIVARRSGEVIHLEALKEYAARVEDLISELCIAVGRFRSEIVLDL